MDSTPLALVGQHKVLLCCYVSQHGKWALIQTLGNYTEARMLHFQTVRFALVFNKENGSLLKIIAWMSRIAACGCKWECLQCVAMWSFVDIPNYSTSIPQSVASHAYTSQVAMYVCMYIWCVAAAFIVHFAQNVSWLYMRYNYAITITPDANNNLEYYSYINSSDNRSQAAAEATASTSVWWHCQPVSEHWNGRECCIWPCAAMKTLPYVAWRTIYCA